MLDKLRKKYTQTPVELRASVVYVICNILQKCLSVITLPLFTDLLSKEQFGEFTVYNSWSSMLTLFLTLYMAHGSFSTAMVRFEKDRSGYISVVQTISAVLCLLFMGIYLPLRSWFNGLFSMSTPLVCVMVAEILTQFGLTCWYTHKRFEFRYVSVVVVTLLVSLCAPLLAYLLVIGSEEKGIARIIGYAAVNIAVGLVFFLYNTFKGRKLFAKEYWSYALKFNIPLVPYYLSQVVLNQSDRIMIEKIIGTAQAALYGVAYQLAFILTFVLNAINNSYVPWFYSKIKEGKTTDNRAVSSGLALLMAFMLMGVIALAPELIYIMGSGKYGEAVWVVPPITVSVLLLMYVQFFVNVEFYYEAKTMLVWGSIGAAIVNVALNLLLIPCFGFVAAGYTTLVSYLAFAVANYLTYRHVVKKYDQPEDAFDLKALLLILLVFCLLTAIAMVLYPVPLARYIIIALVFLGIGIKHKAVIAFVKQTVFRK